MPNKQPYNNISLYDEYKNLNSKIDKDILKSEFNYLGVSEFSGGGELNEEFQYLTRTEINKDKQLMININAIMSNSFYNGYRLAFNNNDIYCFIKDSNNTDIVYCACAFVNKENNLYHSQAKGYFIHSLCTNVNYRKRGFCSKLLNYIIDDLIPKNEYLYMEVDKNNNKAISVYKKIGFEIINNNSNSDRYLCKYKKN